MKDVQLATAGIAPDKINAMLADFARSELAKVIADGTGSSEYDRYVNGRPGADESTVIAPGPINYVFRWWGDIVAFAMTILLDLSPELSGEYKRSWIVRVNGQLHYDLLDIPVDAVVEITNTSDFHRSVVVGHKKYRLGHQNIEAARQKVNSVYGNMITARSTMIQLPGGYVLRGRFRRGFRKFSRRKARADVGAGTAMSYPTLQLSIKGV